jgi:uncharacterized protein (DUF1800 family)
MFSWMTDCCWKVGAVFLLLTPHLWAIDLNHNGQSDVWEMIYNAFNLPANGDPDGDGFTNAQEALAGTNPNDPKSYPVLQITPNGSGSMLLSWPSQPGKRYSLLGTNDLKSGNWTPAYPDVVGTGGTMQLTIPLNAMPKLFFKLSIADQDTDGDGVTDWEEIMLGFDPTTDHTDRMAQTDLQRITAGLTAANTISVSTYRDTCSDDWPEPGIFVVRRTGGLQPLTVNVSYGGTAPRFVHYDSPTGTTVTLAPGQREAFVSVTPIPGSSSVASTETITLTALAGTGYSLATQNSATISLLNQTSTSAPSPRQAARFLIQASFGPDQAVDPDNVPVNVKQVQSMGFSAWIDDQFSRPVGTLSPFIQWAQAQPSLAQIYNDIKQDAWWGRAMGLQQLRPDATTTQQADPLRQRVAFALSQIFVISDNMETLGTNPAGMVNYYDMLETNAFGNYRDLLFGVATHPCMGLFLSHLGNAKADPAANTFPDENFAREVMQLFSIGLWMLNIDGSQQLDSTGQPIPTYDNTTVTQMARVFTGLSHWNSEFDGYSDDFTQPMIGWDAYHDLAPKTLLLGFTTPARTASPGSTGTATFADVNAAIDNIFNHPNVGPFVARQLIQRFITSNPSPGYIARVATAFNNNGSGVRGDMKTVIKTMLLDDEARNPAMRSSPTYGKLREPFLKCVNLAHAFNATSQAGWYYLDSFILDHDEEPLKAPSVFNFYLPTYAPPGALSQSNLVAPEFQIIDASSGVMAPNYFWNAIDGELARWGTGNPAYATRLNLTQELNMTVSPYDPTNPQPPGPPLDPDPLLRRLDLVLTGGTLTPRNFQTIREAMIRITPATWEWPTERLKLGIYLILTSPEFAVQR